MSHIDDGQLNALLDGELSPEDARVVEAHVAGCDACRRRLEEARRFLVDASELLSAVVPPQRVVTPRPTPAGLRTSTPAAAPPPAGAAPGETAPAAPGDVPPRRVSKTAKEVAIDIDGATGQSPAIRLFPQQQERHGAAERSAEAAVTRPRRPLPLRQLAWAASIVITFAVGFAANDLLNSRQEIGRAGPDRVAFADSPAAATAPAEPAAREEARARRSIGPRTPPAPTRTPTGALRRSDAAPVGAGASSSADQRDLAGAGAPATSVTPRAPTQRPQPQAPRRIERQPQGDLAGAAARRAAGPPPANAAAPAAAPGGDTVSRDALSQLRAAEAANAAPAPAPAAPRAFRRTTLDTAVVRLSGSIRLIDGMDPGRVEIGSGRLVNGAAADQDVVRIHYTDERGRRLVFDQQRLAPTRDPSAAAGDVGLLYGDTIVTTSGSTTRVRWLDAKNFWMSLSGPLPADSLRALVARVR